MSRALRRALRAVTRSLGARCHFGVLVIRVSSSTLPSSLLPLRHPSGSIGRPSVISRLTRKARKRRIGGLRTSTGAAVETAGREKEKERTKRERELKRVEEGRDQDHEVSLIVLALCQTKTAGESQRVRAVCERI